MGTSRSMTISRIHLKSFLWWCFNCHWNRILAFEKLTIHKCLNSIYNFDFLWFSQTRTNDILDLFCSGYSRLWMTHYESEIFLHLFLLNCFKHWHRELPLQMLVRRAMAETYNVYQTQLFPGEQNVEEWLDIVLNRPEALSPSWLTPRTPPFPR